jgi:hypothetical protein
LTPEKFEMWKGKLFWDDVQRINLLGVLIENLGVDAVVRLGPLEVWLEALAAAQGQPRELAPRELGELEDDELEDD